MPTKHFFTLGRIQYVARWQMECTKFEIVSRGNAWQRGDREIVWQHFLVNRSFVTGRRSGYGCRSTLL